MNTNFRHILYFILSLFIFSKQVISQDSVTVLSKDGKLPNHRFFLRGELHEFTKDNAENLFALLEFLYHQNHVRYLVMEGGPDQAFLANKYLEKSPDSLEVNIELYLGNSFWKKLHAFNYQLPPGEKIKVLGFDFNRFMHTANAFKYMLGYEPQMDDKILQSALKKIISWDTVKWSFDLEKVFLKDMLVLKNAMKENVDNLKNLLGVNYSEFIRIVFNESPVTPNVIRDRKVIESFLESLTEFTKGNFLFNFGVAHINLDGKGAGAILFASDKHKDQVCSIYPFYAGVKNAKSKSSDVIKKNLPKELKLELKNYSQNTLIDLHEKQVYPSQFRKAQWLMVIKEAK